MALTPPLNHWWHVTLRVSARGVTTGPMPCEAGLAEIGSTWSRTGPSCGRAGSATRDFALHDGLAVAAFHERLFAALEDLGVSCVIRPTPFDLADATPFPRTGSTARTTPTRSRAGGPSCGRRRTPSASSRAASPARRARFSSSGTASTSPSPGSPAAARPRARAPIR